MTGGWRYSTDWRLCNAERPKKKKKSKKKKKKKKKKKSSSSSDSESSAAEEQPEIIQQMQEAEVTDFQKHLDKSDVTCVWCAC